MAVRKIRSTAITAKQRARLKRDYLDPYEIDAAEIDSEMSLTENIRELKKRFPHVKLPSILEKSRAELDKYDAMAVAWAVDQAEAIAY